MQLLWTENTKLSKYVDVFKSNEISDMRLAGVLETPLCSLIFAIEDQEQVDPESLSCFDALVPLSSEVAVREEMKNSIELVDYSIKFWNFWGVRFCCRCDQFLSLVFFHKKAGRLESRCKKCISTIKARAYRHKKAVRTRRQRRKCRVLDFPSFQIREVAVPIDRGSVYKFFEEFIRIAVCK